MRRSKRSPVSAGSSGGSPSVLSEAERRLRVRAMLPVSLDYEPFESPATMKRLLRDLVVWVLGAKIHHRTASAVRGLLRAWIDLESFEKIPQLEERIKQLEAQLKQAPHPTVGIERIPLREELKREGERLMNDPELRRAEGLDS
jgi:hypothetical protein